MMLKKNLIPFPLSPGASSAAAPGLQQVRAALWEQLAVTAWGCFMCPGVLCGTSGHILHYLHHKESQLIHF